MSLDEQPKSLKEASFDMQLFFGFHACMMALMFTHLALHAGIVFEVSVVCSAALAAVILSVRNRRKHGWRWQGATWKNVLAALVTAVLVLYFLNAALSGTTILNPNLFPWFAAGGGILTFGILSALNVVQQTEKQFLRYCGASVEIEPAPPTNSQLPKWKRTLTGIYSTYFLIVWIVAVGSFWKFNSAFRHGSPQPTATQTETLASHGHTVYITPEEKHLVNLLRLGLIPGIPSIFVLGAILHFGFGVKVFGEKDKTT